MSELKKVIAVVGPTASGKTALGIHLAKKYNGEVVSCDSMQVYNNMPIASAAPSVEETDGVVHHLIGFLGPETKFSVADFISCATVVIEEIFSRGKLPIIVGGTGLYIDSLISGISFNDENSEPIRQELEQRADREGIEALIKELQEIDPKTASRYHVNDRKRIIRALEIYKLHGKTKTQLDFESKLKGDRYDCLWIGLTYSDREKLYDRINKRVDIMLENGLINEAETAYNSSAGNTSVQAIGHKEFFPYFKGEISLETAVENLKTETRHYAKRQITWFKRNEKINWIYADCIADIFASADCIVEDNF